MEASKRGSTQQQTVTKSILSRSQTQLPTMKSTTWILFYHKPTTKSSSAELYICKHKARRRDWKPANVGYCSNHEPTTKSSSAELYICKHKARRRDWKPANVGYCSNHEPTTKPSSAELYICKHKARWRDWMPTNVGQHKSFQRHKTC